MMMDAVVARCAQFSPVTVMARLALQQALEPAWVDALFARESRDQYTRELLFSTVVELMSVVAAGLRPSVHAAAQACADLPVSIQALYDKIRRTEPHVVRALVAGSAERLSQTLGPLLAKRAPSVPGYRVRIVDGSHLPASEKRLKPLRGFRGAPLPGQSLVVYDPDRELVVDLEPCEDGHAQERAVMAGLLARAQAGELWIADRNFSTRAILTGWQARGCGFLVREHGRTPAPEVLGERRECGRVDTGAVSEQPVAIPNASGRAVRLRRIEIRLDTPTEGGEALIRLLTNVPLSSLTAQQAARLYRRRWQIETLFQRLESVLHSEIKSLGHPRAALLAFGVAVLTYNVLSVVQSAIRQAHDLQDRDVALSPFYIAAEIRAGYHGMMIAVAPSAWKDLEALPSEQLARLLLRIAKNAKPGALRKHPRGPKPPKKKGYVAGRAVRRHVATARVLRDGGINRDL
jgi:IS4 transposase